MGSPPVEGDVPTAGEAQRQLGNGGPRLRARSGFRPEWSLDSRWGPLATPAGRGYGVAMATTETISEATVLGAGVMGAAIAAHLANAGVRVRLLDIVPRDAPAGDRKARNKIAEAGLEAARKAKPA